MNSYDYAPTDCNPNSLKLCTYEYISTETYPPNLPTTFTAEEVVQLSDPLLSPIFKPLNNYNGYYDPLIETNN